MHDVCVVAWRQSVILEGRPFLTATRGARWVGHCLTRVPASIEVEDGGPEMRLVPRLRRYGSTALYMKRAEYEPTLLVLAGLVAPGSTVLDVGANVGIYSLLLAKRAGPAGRCYSFEPGAEALAQLRVNVSRNPALHIEIVPKALSDAEGSASLFHIGGPITFSMAGGQVSDGEQIAMTTLDAWAARSGLAALDVMKVDVEGHEPAVFLGGRRVLAEHRPLVMFEVSRSALARGGHALDASWNVLADLGYRFYRSEGRSLVPLTAAEDGNLFAIHPDSAQSAQAAAALAGT